LTVYYQKSEEKAIVTLDPRLFRDALGQFPTGVVIATARTPAGERLGMTMSSFNSVSLDPPLILFSVHRHALGFQSWQTVERCAVNILNEDQEQLSNQFARARGDKWEGITPLTGETGVPTLPNAAVVFECEAYARYDGGDHEIFVYRVMTMKQHTIQRGRPLVFFDGRYRQLASAANAHRAPEESMLLPGW
jgi:flavin reductase (DIM6/NTAB) family NADH-FMN oxidoreductase RutF